MCHVRLYTDTTIDNVTEVYYVHDCSMGSEMLFKPIERYRVLI